jgi:hypothetical protein
MARPKGSKNRVAAAPKFEAFTGKFPAPPRIRGVYLTLSKEAIETIKNRSTETGLSPQQVLEDLVAAGDYTMKAVYEPLTKFRKRIREKANNVAHTGNTEETTSETGGHVDRNGDRQGGLVGSETDDSRTGIDTPRSDDAPERPGQRPEDNPAFADPAGVGDVIGSAEEQYLPSASDQELSEWEPEPIEPAPVEEEEEIPQE